MSNPAVTYLLSYAV